MSKVFKAFQHVRRVYPQVCQVFYGVDGRWKYCDADWNAPCFLDSEIDVSVLEEALDSVDKLPAAFGFADFQRAEDDYDSE